MFYEERYSEVYLSPDLPDYVKWAESMGCVGLRARTMEEAIAEIAAALRTLDEDLWSPDRKASEQVLPQILKRYYDKSKDIRTPSKGEFYTLIDYQTPASIESEVVEKLDLIYRTAMRVHLKNNE
jgi:hypothetical protein